MMKRFFKKFRYGEKGFTLIELLVVVAIIGVLAAVVIPNVGRFMGEGSIEGAQTEAHNAQTAVLAAMADTNTFILTDAGTVGPDKDSSVTSGGTVATDLDVGAYLTGNLQAVYTLDTDGQIVSAVPEADGKWKDLEFDVDLGGWYDPNEVEEEG